MIFLNTGIEYQNKHTQKPAKSYGLVLSLLEGKNRLSSFSNICKAMECCQMK